MKMHYVFHGSLNINSFIVDTFPVQGHQDGKERVLVLAFISLSSGTKLNYTGKRNLKEIYGKEVVVSASN